MNKELKFENIKNGIVCFTFDDRNFQGWLNAIPIFEKYNGNGSFFISGEMDKEALSAADKLYKKGHTIGLHSRNHTDAPEYFEEFGGIKYFEEEISSQMQKLKDIGINVTSFAYPNNKRNDETDAFLVKYFKRFRAGGKNDAEKYVPVDMLKENIVMKGFGIGDYYNTIEEDIIQKIQKASRENLCITFFSHNIMENASFIHMSEKLLQNCLSAAQREGVLILGFDELI